MAGDDSRRYARQLTAEFVGTAFLTFVAAGADVVERWTGGEIGHASRYLAPGLMVAALIWSLSGISGAHINPTVTLAFALRRDITFRRAAAYWIVQFAGAASASLALWIFFGAVIAAGVTRPGPGISGAAAAAWEAALTGILIFVILSTAKEKAIVGKNAALAIGFTVALCGLFSSPVTGASMNPARSFGPALLSWSWNDFWVYLAGPSIGALLAASLASLLHGTSRSERETARGSVDEG